MTDHTSKDYDEALERARELIGQMSARVERQLADAVESLQSGSGALIDQILRHEAEVNSLERSIDEFTGQIIARRQPAARDLRLLVALLGATTDLERIGDESKKIALCARSLQSSGRPLLTRVAELRPMAELVRLMLRSATHALASLEPGGAAGLVRSDLGIHAPSPAAWRSCSSPSRSSASATIARTSASTWSTPRWARTCATPRSTNWKDCYRNR